MIKCSKALGEIIERRKRYFTPNEMETVSIAHGKLVGLEEMEEQGRLVILPCKIGDTVYFLQRCLDSYMFVNYGDVIAFHVYRSYITVEVNDHDAFNPFVTLDVSAFGKTVFLTREEAEAAVKGGKDDV